MYQSYHNTKTVRQYIANQAVVQNFNFAYYKRWMLQQADTLLN